MVLPISPMLYSREPSLVLFADALKTAGELDAHFAATNELKGPLHGVPVSFKDLSELELEFEALGTAFTHDGS